MILVIKRVGNYLYGFTLCGLILYSVQAGAQLLPWVKAGGHTGMHVLFLLDRDLE